MGQLEAVVQNLLGDLDPSSLAGLDTLLQMFQNGDLTKQGLGAASPNAPKNPQPAMSGPAASSSGPPMAAAAVAAPPILVRSLCSRVSLR